MVWCKNLTVSKLKHAETGHPSIAFMSTILSDVQVVEPLGHLHPERIVMYILNRQYDQGCRKAVWSPKKSLTLLEPKPAGYDLQEHGEIQDGICLICMDASLRNIANRFGAIQRQVVKSITIPNLSFISKVLENQFTNSFILQRLLFKKYTIMLCSKYGQK